MTKTYEVREIYTGCRVYRVPAESREEARKSFWTYDPVDDEIFDVFYEIELYTEDEGDRHKKNKIYMTANTNE